MSVASYLIDASTIDAHQHCLVVIGADTSDGVLWLGVACQGHKLVGSDATILFEGYDMQTILIASQPELMRQFIIIATLGTIGEQFAPLFVVYTFAGTEQQVVAHRYDSIHERSLHQLRQRGVFHHIHTVVHGQEEFVIGYMDIVEGHIVLHLLRQTCHQIELIVQGTEEIDGASIVIGIDSCRVGGKVDDATTHVSVGCALVQSVVFDFRPVIASYACH